MHTNDAGRSAFPLFPRLGCLAVDAAVGMENINDDQTRYENNAKPAHIFG